MGLCRCVGGDVWLLGSRVDGRGWVSWGRGMLGICRVEPALRGVVLVYLALAGSLLGCPREFWWLRVSGPASARGCLLSGLPSFVGGRIRLWAGSGSGAGPRHRMSIVKCDLAYTSFMICPVSCVTCLVYCVMHLVYCPRQNDSIFIRPQLATCDSPPRDINRKLAVGGGGAGGGGGTFPGEEPKGFQPRASIDLVGGGRSQAFSLPVPRQLLHYTMSALVRSCQYLPSPPRLSPTLFFFRLC